MYHACISLTGHSRDEFERPQHSEGPQRRQVGPRLAVLLLGEQVRQETAKRGWKEPLGTARAEHSNVCIVFNFISIAMCFFVETVTEKIPRSVFLGTDNNHRFTWLGLISAHFHVTANSMTLQLVLYSD